MVCMTLLPIPNSFILSDRHCKSVMISNANSLLSMAELTQLAGLLHKPVDYDG